MNQSINKRYLKNRDVLAGIPISTRTEGGTRRTHKKSRRVQLVATTTTTAATTTTTTTTTTSIFPAAIEFFYDEAKIEMNQTVWITTCSAFKFCIISKVVEVLFIWNWFWEASSYSL
jgi:hypothetical protein